MLAHQTIANYRARLRRLRKAFVLIPPEETEKKQYLGELIIKLEEKLATAPPPGKPGRPPRPMSEEEISTLIKKGKLSKEVLDQMEEMIKRDEEERRLEGVDWSPEAIEKRREKKLKDAEKDNKVPSQTTR